jgi:hypothetical protein
VTGFDGHFQPDPQHVPVLHGGVCRRRAGSQLGLKGHSTAGRCREVENVAYTSPFTHLKSAWVVRSSGVPPMPSRFVQLLPHVCPRFVGEHTAPGEINRDRDQFQLIR